MKNNDERGMMNDELPIIPSSLSLFHPSSFIPHPLIYRR